jgi:hypothetical protein
LVVGVHVGLVAGGGPAPLGLDLGHDGRNRLERACLAKLRDAQVMHNQVRRLPSLDRGDDLFDLGRAADKVDFAQMPRL